MFEKGVLQFFPTAEGYVKNTNFDSANHYNYVFNYTDHLGNVRLSYAEDPAGGLKIMQEDNYYPFGLKHAGYNNSPTYEFAKNVSGNNVVLSTGNVKNKYLYQGQERQDDLGLNWDSFKWRNYDMAIGRFIGIDLLAEKYSYQSPYNFSENRVIDARELEGLEAEKINKGTKNLIISVVGWQGGPEKGKTQPKNDPNYHYESTSFSNKLVKSYEGDKTTQVVVFEPSTTSRTYDDISKTIQDFRKESPDGKLVMVGHSQGGDTVVGVANDNPDIKIDKLITVDISSHGINNTEIPSNVSEAKNYYQTNSFLGGNKINAADGNNTTTVTNVKATNTTHTTIDNDYRFNILNDVKKVIPLKK